MNAKTRNVPIWIRLILVLGLAIASSSCTGTRGERRAAVAGGAIGAVAVGAATHSWVGAAIGGAAGAAVGARVHNKRTYYGRRTLFH